MKIDSNVLEEIDRMTPKYRSQIERDLSNQQRKILITIARQDSDLRVKEITYLARLHQQNRASSQIHRMVEKGYLARQEDGRYIIKDPKLKMYLRARSKLMEIQQ